MQLVLEELGIEDDVDLAGMLRSDDRRFEHGIQPPTLLQHLWNLDGPDEAVSPSDTSVDGAATVSGGPVMAGEVQLHPVGQALPIGIISDIPFGTGAFPQEEMHMDDVPDARDSARDDESSPPATRGNALEAVDAGAVGLGLVDPQVGMLLRESRALNSRRTYKWAWLRILRACDQMDRCPLPMSEATAAMILVDAMNDGLVLGSIKILATTISVAHGLAGQPSPTETAAVRSVMRGIGRVIGDRPDQKVALQASDMAAIRKACDESENVALGTRDWAMLAIGFAGAFRRSEIAALNYEDVEFVPEGVRIHLERSKTDHFSRGTEVMIGHGKDERTCPVRALEAWLSFSRISTGPLFRGVTKHARCRSRRLAAVTVANAVKRYGVVLDLPEDRLGAHSLRAGMVTALIDEGVPMAAAMTQTRHKNPETFNKYYRPRRPTVNFTQAAGL